MGMLAGKHLYCDGPSPTTTGHPKKKTAHYGLCGSEPRQSKDMDREQQILSTINGFERKICLDRVPCANFVLAVSPEKNSIATVPRPISTKKPSILRPGVRSKGTPGRTPEASACSSLPTGKQDVPAIHGDGSKYPPKRA
ncbi:MAG: hypothetical protein Q9209_001411 [Squamulea sp. 1 TL-2023]